MFRLFGIPVRINPFFFITAVVIGLAAAQTESGRAGVPDQWPLWLAVWVVLVFTGVLAHELGHAFAGRMYGLVPSIELYAFGGLTWWREGRPLTPGRSMFVSVAGPLVGIVFGGAGLAWMLSPGAPQEGLEGFTLWSFCWVNLGWALLNLIPMLPLDGGNIMASFFELFTKKNGRRFARYLSIAIAVGLAAWALAAEWWFAVALLAFLGWSNIRDLRAEKRLQALLPYQGLLQKAYRGLAVGDSLALLGAAQELAAADHAQVRAEGQLLLAWARLLRGETFAARQAADAVPAAAAEDSALQAAFLLADDDAEGALRHLEVVGDSDVDQARLGAAFMATDRYDVAVRFFEAEGGKGADPATVERVARAAEGAGRSREALHLRQISLKSQ